ncbi:MAG: kelch repeat-containing protein [Planctomycetota bacterium]|nr:kelch repeat-containing protein [Planctomycetota bacterium]
MPRACLILLVLPLAGLALTARASESANAWAKVAENQIGRRVSPGLLWLDKPGAFVLLGGMVDHQVKDPQPYDIMRWDEAARGWRNELPEAAKARGGTTGPVSNPGFKTPYFEMQDKDGLARPHPYHMKMYYQYAHAPWDGKVYALICGRTLAYDPAARAWRDLQPAEAPAPATRSYKESLCWGALAADPVNEELVLFGGALSNERGGPGTWVYATKTNAWRKLELPVQPPVRALAPMAFDAREKKIVLFGGDRLDQLYADTWGYDCASRTWEERKPPVSPAPRFGHALVYLPKAGQVLLLGGKTYTSSTAYQATLYKPLPFEAWTYDVAANVWTKLKTAGEPAQRANRPLAAAANARDEVMLLADAWGSKNADETWLAAFDAKQADAEGTAQGVPPGTLEFRSESYDPAWYEAETPAPDPAAFSKFLAELPANAFVEVKAPKWPLNRQGGGWSTVALDTDGDRLLHIGGGHSSYFGNDVAHFDLKTGRWSISCRPQFALEFNYDLSGPGEWAFNGAPWGNHNYKAYAYDPATKRMVLAKSVTMFYDPERKCWPFEETFETRPFAGSKYVTFLCPTPHGLYAWGKFSEHGKDPGLFRLRGGKAWEQVKTSGEALPVPVCDKGSTLVYDSKRDRFLFTSVFGAKTGEGVGQVWSCARESGAVQALNPQGAGEIKAPRWAREAVYLPGADAMLCGSAIQHGEKLLTPCYDATANAWYLADLPGAAEAFNGGKTAAGCGVDLGLAYDASRGLVWAVSCKLHPGALKVLRFDAASAAKTELK